jgi:hypothetical protein
MPIFHSDVNAGHKLFFIIFQLFKFAEPFASCHIINILPLSTPAICRNNEESLPKRKRGEKEREKRKREKERETKKCHTKMTID